MADIKVTALPAAGAIQTTDLLYAVQDVPTTPTSNKLTVAALTSYLNSTVTIPAGQVTGLAAIATSGSAADIIAGTLAVARGGTGVTSSTGTGSVVLSNSPTLVTPALGTPSAAVLTNATGLPLSTGVSGVLSSSNGGTGVNNGSATVTLGGNLVTSGAFSTTLTSTATTAVTLPTSGTLYGTATGSITSSQLAGSLSDETGTGSAVFATSPTLVTPSLGTPSSAVLTNATGLPFTTGLTGTPTTISGYGITDAQPLNNNLTGLAALTSGGGIVAKTGAGTFTQRTLTGTAGRIGIANSTGVAGNPTFDIDSGYVGQTSITTLGTITTGTWNGTTVAVNRGGTGVTSSKPVIQRVNTQTGAVATGTTTIPFDDTIPQITEGDQYMTLAITPSNASNILEIQVVLCGSHSVVSALSAGLFQDATANALAAAFASITTTGGVETISFTHTMTAGTTSSTTFRVRAGANNAGTTTFNGNSGNRVFGGVAASSITITEYAV